MSKEIEANLIESVISKLVAELKIAKPNDRSELDRRFAIAVTEAEKLQAYIITFILPVLK